MVDVILIGQVTCCVSGTEIEGRFGKRQKTDRNNGRRLRPANEVVMVVGSQLREQAWYQQDRATTNCPLQRNTS